MSCRGCGISTATARGGQRQVGRLVGGQSHFVSLLAAVPTVVIHLVANRRLKTLETCKAYSVTRLAGPEPCIYRASLQRADPNSSNASGFVRRLFRRFHHMFLVVGLRATPCYGGIAASQKQQHATLNTSTRYASDINASSPQAAQQSCEAHAYLEHI
jgi:hypothetical protein